MTANALERPSGRPAVGMDVLSVDVSRLVYDVGSAFNPLSPGRLIDYHVEAPRDGVVLVSLAMPVGLFRPFLSLLDSLAGLVKVIDLKGRAASAQAKAVDPVALDEADKSRALIRSLIVQTFDAHTKAGVDVQDAVKQTNRSLKAQGHVWSTFQTVFDVLRSTGRLRKRRAVHGDGSGV